MRAAPLAVGELVTTSMPEAGNNKTLGKFNEPQRMSWLVFTVEDSRCQRLTTIRADYCSARATMRSRVRTAIPVGPLDL